MQVRRDQQGSHKMPTEAAWGARDTPGTVANVLGDKIDEMAKGAVIFHMPCDCRCTVVTTFKVLMSGQPGF